MRKKEWPKWYEAGSGTDAVRRFRSPIDKGVFIERTRASGTIVEESCMTYDEVRYRDREITRAVALRRVGRAATRSRW